jgi:6,7-dimethyl-8-ribityllumazine synthase
MSQARPQNKTLDGRGRRVAIIVGRYNSEITNGLLAGARETLLEAGMGAGDIQVHYVAGAFEIPLVAQRCLETGRTDGVIALAAVIRGDTPHFDFVCQATAEGCLRVTLDTSRPLAFGVLTCDNQQQAQVRAAPGPGNKGREAALALLESLTVLERI